MILKFLISCFVFFGVGIFIPYSELYISAECCIVETYYYWDNILTGIIIATIVYAFIELLQYFLGITDIMEDINETKPKK